MTELSLRIFGNFADRSDGLGKLLVVNTAKGDCAHSRGRSSVDVSPR